MPDNSQPWYTDLSKEHHFKLHRKIKTRSETRFRNISVFPESWTTYANIKIHGMWNNVAPLDESLWKNMILQYRDAMILTAEKRIFIMWLYNSRPPVQIDIPANPNSKYRKVPTDKIHAAWVLNPESPYDPLVVFSDHNLLYVYNINAKTVESYLRGHGGAITSIAVHPRYPNIFCTTSRDFTTRVYDLTYPPRGTPDNPHWPPLNTPSRAGPAHGLDMTMEEGSGRGRCVMVLAGGRSGGHQADVLGAAFHPFYPLLATCGMDRAVKIWFMPTMSPRLTREDKPLFSSTMIHRARVLSVTWITAELLLTHSAPAEMRRETSNSVMADFYLEPGTLVLWRWLGFDRFFPANWDEFGQQVMRGLASDFQESASFKIISSTSLPAQEDPYRTPAFHAFSERCRAAFVLYAYPEDDRITLLNVALLGPRPRLPPMLDDDEDSDLVEHTRLMNLADGSSAHQGWKLVLSDNHHNSSQSDSERVESCVMGMGGTLIFAVGSKGGIWVWRDVSA